MMKTFSRFSLLMLICFGFALMLGGNAVAQSVIKFDTIKEDGTVRPGFEVGDTTELTIVLYVNGIPQANQPVNFSSMQNVTFTDASGVAGNNASLMTAIDGSVSVNLTFNEPGDPIQIDVAAPSLPGGLQTHTVLYRVIGRVSVTRIISTPLVSGPVAVGDTVEFKIDIKSVVDLSAWQMDISYNAAVLGNPMVTEGGFLTEGGTAETFFSPGTNASGKISGITQARIGRDPITGIPVPGVSIGESGGMLLTVKFDVMEFGEDTLGLTNVLLSNAVDFPIPPDPAVTNELDLKKIPSMLFNLDPLGDGNDRMSYHVVSNPVVVTHRFVREDVNRDGNVDVLDLVAVAAGSGGRADVNNDGMVNVLDLILVARHPNFGQEGVATVEIRGTNDQVGTAPAMNVANVTPQTIQGWIDLMQVEDDGSAIFDLGIANLEALLASRIPTETRLLLNYPNPFNPETWIPYQLAKATDVTVAIHSMNGSLIRTLELGHQAAGIYRSKSQAAHWDGRNEFGEQVASGLYFYTLTAGDFSATHKMLIRK